VSFEYDKMGEHTEENWWTAYSDLFLSMSVVFLLLYVIASMRSGISGIQQKMEYAELKKHNGDLQQQIQVYNALKDEQLQHESTEEQDVYKKLMDRLSLLQDEARDEKDKLRRQAKENEEKEFALNQYQQIVRNIINTNLLAKTQIKRKDTLITEKNLSIKEKQKVIEQQESEIAQNQQDIDQLENTVQQKEATINDNQQKIDQINTALDSKINQLKAQQQAAQISKAQLNTQIEQLTQESQQKIAELDARKAQAQQALAATRASLEKAQQDIVEQQRTSAAQREALMKEMEEAKGQYEGQIGALQAEHQKQLADGRLALERAKQMSAKQRSAAEAKLRAEAAAQQREYEAALGDLKGRMGQANQALAQNKAEYERLSGELQNTEGALARANAERGKLAGALGAAKGQLAQTQDQLQGLGSELGKTKGALAQAEGQVQGLGSELGKTKGALSQAQGQIAGLGSELGKTKGALGAVEAEKERLAKEHGRALAAVQNLKQERENLSGELKRAQEIANAKKRLVGMIKQNLRGAGLESQIDEKTGDVVLSFGEEYFDTGSAVVKPSMTGILKKFMPAYSDSLFNDPKISEKITNVEIIGFASPTYKGYYVNPESLNPVDQEAIRYNVKLSSARAQSIFNYIFDTKKMKYEKQRDLLPKVKVVGRGYLPEGKKWGEIPKGLSEGEFCKRFDCRKAQRVIIRFNME
jgi:chromosome segregation ATPase